MDRLTAYTAGRFVDIYVGGKEHFTVPAHLIYEASELVRRSSEPMSAGKPTVTLEVTLLSAPIISLPAILLLMNVAKKTALDCINHAKTLVYHAIARQ